MQEKTKNINFDLARRPLIIEMVGIAGAGKTTLREELRKRDKRIQYRIPPGKLYYVPFLLKNTFRWLPIYLWKYRKNRWFTVKETQIMGYMETWIPYLKGKAIRENIMVVLDPGSIYWLTELLYFGPKTTRIPKFIRWWNQMFRQWNTALDLIIWLDAPNEILLERVLAREQWHEAKENSKAENLKMFNIYRSGYKKIIARMKAENGPQVLRFYTNQVLTGEMADIIEAILNRNRN